MLVMSHNHIFKVGERVRAIHDVSESGIVVLRQGEEGNITAIGSLHWQLPYAVAFDRRCFARQNSN